MTRLPKRVVFPFGYICKVKQVTQREMQDALDLQEEEEVPDGGWDVETQTVFICKRLSLKRKCYILGHELIHALNDYIHDCINNGIMEP